MMTQGNCSGLVANARNRNEAYGWASCMLLVPAIGTDGSTTIPDVSASAHTLTCYGNAQITANRMAFDGSGDYILSADSADWDLGSGDFFIECWARLDTLPGSGSTQPIVGQWSNNTATTYGNKRGWLCDILNSSGTYKLQFEWSTNGNNNFTVNGNMPAGFKAGREMHIAWGRSGGFWRGWVNGSQVYGSATTATINNSARPLTIGAYDNSGSTETWIGSLNGRIRQLRIFKGLNPYPGEFFVPRLPFYQG